MGLFTPLHVHQYPGWDSNPQPLDSKSSASAKLGHQDIHDSLFDHHVLHGSMSHNACQELFPKSFCISLLNNL